MTVEEALEYFLTDREIHQMWNTAFDIATDALEKQMPKKRVWICNETGLCPICKQLVVAVNYCPNCGQKLDWSDDNDD